MAAIAPADEAPASGWFRLPRWRRSEAQPAEPGTAPPDLEPTIWQFIIKHSWRSQLVALAITLASFPFLYMSLDLPKTIINHAIRADAKFPQYIFGIDFDRVPYLMLLCGAFLATVLINGGFKYCINTYKGRLGERMLRRFRYQLYVRLLRFPLTHFHKTSAAQIIPMVTAESESLGGFIGDALALPAFQGGTLLTIIFFMFVQDPVLGLAAIALYPFQGYIIPKLQRKVNQLAKQRVRTARIVADRIQESAAGIVEIHSNNTVKLQLTDFAGLLGRIYDIRYEIYKRKFFVKFLNNFIGQLTPFFFYSIGGYLVIRGNLSFGALVAVLAAYKDMASPWKELLDFYQQKEDSRIKYEQIVEQFQPAGLTDLDLMLRDPGEIPRLQGELAVSNLSLAEDDRNRIIDAVTFSMRLDEHVAVIGPGGSGKNELALLLARLMRPTGGRITIAGRELGDMPLAIVGHRIGYVGATPYLFTGTLRDNLLLALRHRPVRPAEYSEDEARRRARQEEEARRSGNIDFDLHADWVDYAAAGVGGAEELSARIVELLTRLDFETAVYNFGLRSRIDAAADPELTARLLEVRRALRDRLAADGLTNLVETFDPERYNTNASVAENLLFGTPIGPVFDFEALAGNTHVRAVLDTVGLTEDLIEAGRQVAATMTEMFTGLPPDHEFFDQFSFISSEELPELSAILAAADKAGVAGLHEEQRQKLLALPFRLIAARHRLDIIDEKMQERLLEARRVFRRDLPEEAKGEIEFFDPERYNASASLQDNILFGKIAYGEADAPVRVPTLISELLNAMSLRATVVDIGLDYEVGTGGSRLSLAQRQRAAIARALLKRPDLLILNEATTALDGHAEAKVGDGIRQDMAGRGLIWVLHRASLARNFDRLLVMSGGKLREQGTFAELNRRDTLTGNLLAAE
ncbi:MAG TPA: ABC transporter ATP-binding protein/permease [Stellaceae bacterium]|nr:ABC transporter ATP-binding protein/permease [Stellaceae bacterium]